MLTPLFAVLLSTAPAPGPGRSAECLGVYLQRQERVVRIMWVDVIGKKQAVHSFAAAAALEGYTSTDIRVADDPELTGPSEAHVVFTSPRTTFKMADDLMRRAGAGEFGQLDVYPMVMPAADGEMQKCLGGASKHG